MAIFTFIFAVFLPHSTAEIQMLSVLKTNYWYVGILLPVSNLVAVTFTKVKNYLHTKFPFHFNPRLRYYYFRFLKTNGRHIEILHAVSILSRLSATIFDSAFAYQILTELDDRRPEPALGMSRAR